MKAFDYLVSFSRSFALYVYNDSQKIDTVVKLYMIIFVKFLISLKCKLYIEITRFKTSVKYQNVLYNTHNMLTRTFYKRLNIFMKIPRKS